jgi:hypothetical protein
MRKSQTKAGRVDSRAGRFTYLTCWTMVL